MYFDNINNIQFFTLKKKSQLNDDDGDGGGGGGGEWRQQKMERLWQDRLHQCEIENYNVLGPCILTDADIRFLYIFYLMCLYYLIYAAHLEPEK
ncbi:hypothetical protein DERF_003497 [Dermatophagoides farinae]|uniref:Uncharacterized protein n=1 Tax=Dermatophagoides farinae TaxID=6954 RepID=A0A922IDP8_DERFA|nr:hypothetical protein DERF_003497 [Dermatophagoides farinae]